MAADPKTTANAGRDLAAKLNAAFRRHCGLGDYVHAGNWEHDVTCMHDAMQEIGLLDTAPDLEQLVRAFIYWVAANEHTDPDGIFVCAEWHNLCDAVGEPMRMPGSVYRQRCEEMQLGQ